MKKKSHISFVLRRLEFLGLYSYLKIQPSLGRRSSSFQGDSSIKRLAKLRITGYFATVALLFLSFATISPIYIEHTPVEAESGTATPSTLTFTSIKNSASVNLNVTSKDGTFATSDDNERAQFSISTNNYTGYTLTLKSGGTVTNTDLDNAGTKLSTIPTDTTKDIFSANTDAGKLLNNKWGIIPNYYNATGDTPALNTTNYYPAPAKNGSIPIRKTNKANSTNGIDNPDTYTIGLGLRADYTNPSGTYTNNTFILEYVANEIGYVISYSAGSISDVTNLPTSISGNTNTTITLDNKTGNTSTYTTNINNIALTYSPAPERSGYNFIGWCHGELNTDGTQCNSTSTTPGKLYKDGEGFGIDKTTSNIVTLYAVWEKTLTFDEAFVAAGKSKWNSTEYYAMQDMTTAICGSVTGWDVDTDAPTTQLVDTRDNKIYYVSKLKDGNCWMTQNLDLGSSAGDINLTPTDSDVASNFTLTAPGSLDFSDANYDAINYRDPGEQYYVSSGSTSDDTSYTSKSACESANSAELCQHSHAGNYYNWYTATAGTGTQAMGNRGQEATRSICPKGWRLPMNSSALGAKSYYNLLHNYDIMSSDVSYTTNGFNNIRSNPLYFVRSGSYDTTSLISAAVVGYYWSSTAYSGTDAYNLHFGSSYVDPQYYSFYYYKYNGRSVRCLARNIPTDVTVSYDQNTTDPVSNMPTTQTLVNFDGETTPLTISSQVPTRDGYNFAGWSRNPNSESAEYQPGETRYLYLSSSELHSLGGELKLYAVWEKNIYVSYNDNGGSGGPGSNVSAGNPTTGLALATTQPTRSGYYFDGWSLNQSAEWADYRAGATFSTTDISDGSTLYAVWKSTPYTIIYNDNGGSGGPGTVTYDSYTVTISNTKPTASSTSSSFNGWSESPSPSSGPIAADSTYSFPLRTNSITLYAYYAACIIEGTPIILADGTTKPVEDLTGDEDLLAWDFETGSYVSRPIVFIDADSADDYHVIYTTFSDGTRIGNVSEHGYFDLDLGKFIYIDDNNPEQYIGHHFVKQDGNGWTTVTLDSIEHKIEHLAVYSLNTFGAINFYTDGMLSMPGGIKGMFNYFDVDTTTMAYDPAKKAADLATYGEFTYDDFKDVISELGYEAFNGRYLKVSIGKGLITWDGIKALADRYNPLIDSNGS